MTASTTSRPARGLLIALVLALVGCGSEPDPPERHIRAADGRPAPAELKGTWETTFSRKDVGNGAISPGRWLLKISDNRYEVEAPDGDVTRGNASWSAILATFSNDARCIEAGNYRAGPGTYRWSEAGGKLLFTRTSLTEVCDPRAAVLPTHEWRLVGRRVDWKPIPDSPATALAPGATGIDPKQAIPASAARPLPRRLAGTYHARLTADDVAGRGQLQPGTLRLVLRGREYQIQTPDRNVTRGRARWTAGRVSFLLDSDCTAFARERRGPGTYLWNARARSLAFAFAGGAEACEPRRTFLTTKLFTRVSRSTKFAAQLPAVAPPGSAPKPPDPTDPIPPGGGVPVPSDVGGTYSATFTKADVAGKGATPTGRWQLILDGNRYRLYQPNGALLQGTARWTADRVTFTRDIYCRQGAPAAGGPATYYWAGGGSSLTFRYTGSEEPCSLRGPGLTTKGWAR